MNAIETNVLRDFKNRVGERLPLHAMILFGSRARGDADPDSDMDVLVILKGPVDAVADKTVSECALGGIRTSRHRLDAARSLAARLGGRPRTRLAPCNSRTPRGCSCMNRDERLSRIQPVGIQESEFRINADHLQPSRYQA